MADVVDDSVKVTPLVERHRALGARLIDFAGWLMPVQYSGILEEHRAVRERAGLFDLSHMGELFVEGPEAGAALAHALVSDPPALAVGRAHYSMICAEDGGILDDLIVYRLAEEGFLVVANASNAQLVSDLLVERSDGFRAILDDRSAGDRARRGPGPPVGRDPRSADRRGPRRAALLRDRRGPGRGDRGTRGPNRLHGRGRVRGLRRERAGRRAVGCPARGRPAGRDRPGRPRRPRHPEARGGHAALRQRPRSDRRTRTRPGSVVS